MIRLLASAMLLLTLWLLQRLLLWAVWRRTDAAHVRYRWRKVSGYTVLIAAFLGLAFLWLDQGLRPFGTFFGLLSAGVAISLRDIISGLAGWLFIVWRRPFEVGDRIQIGAVAGDVIDIRFFQFTLLEIGNWVAADQSTGRIIHIPNGRVFTEALASYSKGFQYIWNEIPVLITFESDWEKAKKLFLRVAERHGEDLSRSAEAGVREAARRFLIHYRQLTPTVYTCVRDSGILLTVRYLCEPRRRRSSEEAVWEGILQAVAGAPDIQFAYSTHRLVGVDLPGSGLSAPDAKGTAE